MVIYVCYNPKTYIFHSKLKTCITSVTTGISETPTELVSEIKTKQTIQYVSVYYELKHFFG